MVRGGQHNVLAIVGGGVRVALGPGMVAAVDTEGEDDQQVAGCAPVWGLGDWGLGCQTQS